MIQDFMAPKIYLAGPAVFHPQAAKMLAELQEICACYGLRGVVPAEAGEMNHDLRGVTASRIKNENLKRIKASAGVMAELTPFRNPVEPDSGTAFECGYAVALGIPVCGFITALPFLHEKRIIGAFGQQQPPGCSDFDGHYGQLIERFGLPANLMLASSFPVFPSAREAAKELKRQIDND